MNLLSPAWVRVLSILVVFLAILAAGCQGVARSASSDELGRLFKAERVEGTFVLFDPQAERWIVHDRLRAHKRYLPASTFKVPNTLIALETGVAGGPEHKIAWDRAIAPPQDWWPQVWKQDHTLRTALPNSVVWYYQAIARQIGKQRMQDYINRFDYGNRNIAGGIDQFWLEGELRISAMEQIEFLRRFYFGELGVSQRTLDITRELLVLEDTPTFRLSGKTGWAKLGNEAPEGAPGVGWFVGYLERGQKVYFFAMNIDIHQPEDAAARRKITEAALRQFGLMD